MSLASHCFIVPHVIVLSRINALSNYAGMYGIIRCNSIFVAFGDELVNSDIMYHDTSFVVLHTSTLYHSCSFQQLNLCSYKHAQIKKRIDGYNLDIPRVNSTTYGLNSLAYQGAKIWNGLTQDLQSAISLNSFKRLLGTWTGESCRCAFCRKWHFYF